MQIKSIGYQPNFQAKFIKNEAITEAFKKEIEAGNIEHLEHALNELNKHHTNVALLYSKNGTVTNLFNNKTTTLRGINANSIDSLSNLKTSSYRNLFKEDQILTPYNISKNLNRISNLYLVNTSPNYNAGKNIKSYNA